MHEKLIHRGGDASGIYLTPHAGLSHQRLSIRDFTHGAQPMIRHRDGADYAIVYNGEIYNTDELIPELTSAGYNFLTTSDTEVILYAYMHFGASFVSRLNGIFSFAIWDGAAKQLFLYRDRVGTKPLFYHAKDGELVFASEPKALFCFPDLSPAITENSLRELLAVGPARTPGCGVFQDIYEVLPGHYLCFDAMGLSDTTYWDLKCLPHTDPYEDTVAHVSFLMRDTVKRQMISDVPVCTFLSGGIDSSIVTALAAAYQREHGEVLNTFSFDFTENDIYFKSNSFQPERDLPYVNCMLEHCKTSHTYLECTQETLADMLYAAVDAKDMPGMTDVDASLLYFCSLVKKQNKVTLTGECADEIFGGYPWFYREDLLASDTFPWMTDLTPRKQLLDPEFADALQMDDYVKNLYHQIISEIPVLPEESDIEKSRRRIGYMNIRMFMQTLLDRMDRTSMYHGLEARVPFADIHLNVPWKYKYRNQTEKSLLRHAAVNLVPNEILFRKKSPYPKTYNPLYETILADRLREVIHDVASPVNRFLDKKAVLQFLESPKDYGKPWYGQLMPGPQMLAYVLQISNMLRKYNL